MTDLAPHLSAFLKQYLPHERNFSRHTVQSYTDCFRLLVLDTAQQLKVRPCQLQIEHFTTAQVTDFLARLQHQRGNRVATSNIRLAAIKSFFRYLEYRLPCCLELALQIRAMPMKRTDKPLIDWLDHAELQALFDAPDPTTSAGRRDRAMLHLCYAAGLRVAEVTTLTLDSLSYPDLNRIRIVGKGRRQRELPLWNATKTALHEWLEVRPEVNHRFMFVNARGRAMGADGFRYILKRHVSAAAQVAPSLQHKKVTPHVLRHSVAMSILQSTGDVRKVSLWLGHADLKTTEMYLRASPVEKLQILQTNTPPSIQPGTFAGVEDQLVRLLSGK